MEYTIEQIARWSDHELARRRFEERNLGAANAVSWLLFFIAFAEFAFAMTAAETPQLPWQKIVASVSLVVPLLALAIIGDLTTPGRWRPAPLRAAASQVQHHLNAYTLGFLIAEFVLALAYFYGKRGWLPWAMLFPLFTIVFRFFPAEAILLHGFLLTATAAYTFLPATKLTSYVVVICAVLNAFALAFQLLLSKRMRYQRVSAWNDRRVQAREQLRMRDELQIARALQLSMLPERAPRLDWVDLFGISIPATEVGGDYFDYFTVGNRVAIVCGDVAGHGLASGIVLAALRSGLILLRDSLIEPATVLRRLHEVVIETSRRRTLVTMSIVLLDRDSRMATIASAGHPPIIIRRASGETATVDLSSPPLGVYLPFSSRQQQISFAAGDLFVLHSDGVYETRNASEDEYGLERLRNIVRATGSNAESVCKAVIQDVERFRGAIPQQDDVTVVAAKIN
jgi:serine phosphatase RsbU (regulator of sigma subunit)